MVIYSHTGCKGLLRDQMNRPDMSMYLTLVFLKVLNLPIYVRRRQEGCPQVKLWTDDILVLTSLLEYCLWGIKTYLSAIRRDFII